MIKTELPSFGLKPGQYILVDDSTPERKKAEFIGHVVSDEIGPIPPFTMTEAGEFVYLAYLMEDTRKLFRCVKKGKFIEEKASHRGSGKYVVVLEGEDSLKSGVYDIKRFRNRHQALAGFNNQFK